MKISEFTFNKDQLVELPVIGFIAELGRTTFGHCLPVVCRPLQLMGEIEYEG